jgi:hypothetical protein
MHDLPPNPNRKKKIETKFEETYPPRHDRVVNLQAAQCATGHAGPKPSEGRADYTKKMRGNAAIS